MFNIKAVNVVMTRPESLIITERAKERFKRELKAGLTSAVNDDDLVCCTPTWSESQLDKQLVDINWYFTLDEALRMLTYIAYYEAANLTGNIRVKSVDIVSLPLEYAVSKRA